MERPRTGHRLCAQGPPGKSAPRPCQGRPDLAIEIVSPDSIERDYQKKRRQYERASVPEYWIIDEIEKTVLLLRLDAHGKYQEVRLSHGIMRSQVLKGFWIDSKWLWQSPLPDVMATLNKIV